MKKTKHLLPICLAPALLLASCSFDLGTFEKDDNYDSYYQSFDEVKGLYEVVTTTETETTVSGEEKDYDIKKSLFNSKTVEDFNWENDSDKVVPKEYVYIIITAKADVKIEEIAMFFYAYSNADIEISSYYYAPDETLPVKIKYKHSPDVDADEQLIEYDDPTEDRSVCSTSLSISKYEWEDFSLSGFKGNDDKCLHMAADSLLYIRIDNNSGLYKDLQPVAYSFINLLVRAVE